MKRIYFLTVACFLIIALFAGCTNNSIDDAQLPEGQISGIAAQDRIDQQSPVSPNANQEEPLVVDFTGEIASCERLPLQEYRNCLNYSQEQIDEFFWQMFFDTQQARYMAYKIWLALGYSGNLTGDFIAIENAPMDKLIEQAIFSTMPIDPYYYREGLEVNQNNIVSRTFIEASKDGMALGDIFYADDIEQTLILLYGDYPVAREGYKDHFTDTDHIEYYPDESLFLQRFDWGGARKKPLILNLQESTETIVCDFITVDFGYNNGRYYYEVNYEVELTPENFKEETADLGVLRFTFHYAEDDGRPLLYSVESLGKLGSLLQKYDLYK
jgi:hypothetical protein